MTRPSTIKVCITCLKLVKAILLDGYSCSMLDESVLYLGESIGRSSQMQTNTNKASPMSCDMGWLLILGEIYCISYTLPMIRLEIIMLE